MKSILQIDHSLVASECDVIAKFVSGCERFKGEGHKIPSVKLPPVGRFQVTRSGDNVATFSVTLKKEAMGLQDTVTLMGTIYPSNNASDGTGLIVDYAQTAPRRATVLFEQICERVIVLGGLVA